MTRFESFQDERTIETEADKSTPVEPKNLARSIEALLMAADAPLSIDQIIRLLEGIEAVDRDQVKQALKQLDQAYIHSAADVVEVASGWRLQVASDYSALVARLWEERPPKLSRAMLETLAIICYRQPLARSDIEAVRGVSVSSNIVKTLTEYGWIKVVGHREVPGRPALYGTTPDFLDDFGVKRLSDLPSLPEIKNLESLDDAIAELRRETTDSASSTDVSGNDPSVDDRVSTNDDS